MCYLISLPHEGLTTRFFEEGIRKFQHYAVPAVASRGVNDPSCWLVCARLCSNTAKNNSDKDELNNSAVIRLLTKPPHDSTWTLSADVSLNASQGQQNCSGFIRRVKIGGSELWRDYWRGVQV